MIVAVTEAYAGIFKLTLFRSVRTFKAGNLQANPTNLLDIYMKLEKSNLINPNTLKEIQEVRYVNQRRYGPPI